MRLVVAGSRDIDNRVAVQTILNNFLARHDVDEIMTGGARGVDDMAHRFAEERGIDNYVVKADWEEHGRAAGPIRNEKMAKMGDALLAIWDGKSSGTRSMIDNALNHSLDVTVKVLDEGLR